MKRIRFHYPKHNACAKSNQLIDKTKTQNSEDETEKFERKQLKNKHKCSICNYDFQSKANLNSHIRSIHDNNKAFTCNICEAKFALKTLLKS